jgi:hypothetical protein
MHDIKALISSTEALRNSIKGLTYAVVCPLTQGFALLPLTDDLLAELNILTLNPKSPHQLQAPPLKEISDVLYELALKISTQAPVAYVATFYFGGDGGQEAVAWNSEKVIFSPLCIGYGCVEWPNSSISQALRAIGVSRIDERQDEFDSIGLGNYRETHRWYKAFAVT